MLPVARQVSLNQNLLPIENKRRIDLSTDRPSAEGEIEIACLWAIFLQSIAYHSVTTKFAIGL